MTKRQRKYWEQRFRKQELSLINYYDKHPDNKHDPDGSFCMNAFLLGWESAMRAVRKEQANG